MELNWIDVTVFVAFVAGVITLGLSKSRKEETGEDYFLAGRGLKWWLIGFSLIAANISTEQFVGMSGAAASHVGLAIASYEWMAAITLIVVAFAFLPYFLRAGIYTMPEFLEVRYDSYARLIMAVATIFIYMLLLGSVTYAGAVTIRALASDMGYNVPLFTGALVIGLIAMVYVATGGLKACAWADLLQGSALIVGGAVILYFAFSKLGSVNEASTVVNVATGEVGLKALAPDQGAMERFLELNRVRLNMFLPRTDSVLPWTALCLGLWIPNFYYWGLNQYITQRTLGSASLAQGQKGIVFAAFMKLIIPFVIVVPGIIAFNLYAGDMQKLGVADNVTPIVKYYKANQDTQSIMVLENPSEQLIADWNVDGRYLVAVFDTAEAKAAASKDNPFVLPITQADYDAIPADPFVQFKTDDKAMASLSPSLMQELEAYNQTVAVKAEEAGKKVSTEKFIGYKYDTAMAQLIGKVLPQKTGLVGFVLAALLGAVVSSLAAMLNAASTIVTMDIFKKYVKPEASQKLIVLLGRGCVVVFSFIAIGVAPMLGNPKIGNSIFTIIQEGQGFISPGILAVFAFGLLIRRGPSIAGALGLLTSICSYGFFKVAYPNINFLNRMAICFGICVGLLAVLSLLFPGKKPVVFTQNTNIELHSSKGALICGFVVILLTVMLYLVFSPLVLAK